MSTILIRVLLGLYRMTAANLLTLANAVYAGMNANPAYPNPPVAMPAFSTAISTYSAAVTAALDGGAKAVAQRNELGVALGNMLRQLANYVEANSNGNMTTFLSSGFQAVSSTRTKAQPVSEYIRKIVSGATTGQLAVTLVAIPGAVSYELRWASVPAGGAPGAWTSQPVPLTRPETAIVSLTPGTTYIFQARALTRSGMTDWSESVTRICQ
jgi:hypothetical protein